MAGVQTEQVLPATGLLRLAGLDDVTAINSALRSNHVESAYSLISTSTRLSDEERIGSLLLIGKRYSADNNADRARAAYRQIMLIATLSPTLSDFARADGFLQAGEEFARLNQSSEAMHALNQARTVAMYSVYLKAAHRKHVLDRLVPAYTALGAGRSAWEDLEVALQPGGSGQTSVEPVDPVLPRLAGEDAPLPDVQPALVERQQKANALAEFARDRGGKLSDTLVLELGKALTVEDALRQGAYQSGLVKATQLADRIGLLGNRVHWLAIKHGVAHRATGVSLVPDWEQQVGVVESDLAKAWQDLYAAYADQVVALPDASAIDRAWLELYREELLMGRLGLYPNYPEQQLDGKLREATIKLMSTGRDRSLRVDSLPGESPFYFLADGPDYGKGYLPQ